MKILFISESYPPYIKGGAEISTSLLASRLAKDHTVSVACSRFTKTPWTENGVMVYPIVSGASVGAKNISSAISYAIGITVAPVVSAIRILRLIKKLDPDVINIVVTLYYYIPIVLLIKLFSRRPIFIDCRDYSLICPMGFKNDEINDPLQRHHGYRCLLRGYHVDDKFLRLFIAPFAAYESLIFNLYKSILRYAINHGKGMTLVPLSHYVQQQLILNGFQGRKIVVIPNISRRIAVTGPAKKAAVPTFAYGGRIEKEKGIWDLVAAVELLQKETAQAFSVTIAGTGSIYEDLKDYLDKNRSIPITLLGKIPPDEVISLYRESLAIVAPSRWPEPFGRFIQESISTGIPVIATSAGGIPEGIQNDVTGVLFEVGKPEQLAAAMKMFIEHPDLSRTMGLAMAKQMVNYDNDHIAERRLDLYRNGPKQQTKILHVTSTGYPIGGAPIIVLLLRNEFLKRGYEVKVLSSNKKGEGMFNDYELALISKRSPIKALHHLFYFRSYFLMRKIIKDFRPDIIHFHNIDAFSPSIFFAIGNTPAVMTVHGPEEFTRKLLPWVLLPEDYKKRLFDLHDLTTIGLLHYWYYRSIQGPVYRRILRRVAAFIAPSKYMAEAIREDVLPEKIRQIYYGAPLPSVKPLPDNQRILYVGRLEDVKGVDVLIRSFAMVAKKMPMAELRIVGDGSARESLERLTADLGLSARVTFCGWIKTGGGVVREYEDASLLVVPSVWPEAFGLVCIEALAVGRPVIGSRTGALPELIEDGKTGYIVPVRDEIALSDALMRLLGDRKLLGMMSKAAEASVARFDTTLFINTIEALYKEVIDEHPRDVRNRQE